MVEQKEIRSLEKRCSDGEFNFVEYAVFLLEEDKLKISLPVCTSYMKGCRYYGQQIGQTNYHICDGALKEDREALKWPVQ